MKENEFVIEVKNLHKEFFGREVVCGIDLSVKPGEIYGFLGPNGSGKTTTIRMICGLLMPNAGTGHCLGLDIIKDAVEIKRQVGYMTQHFSLYDDLTIRENLMFIARVYQMDNRKQRVQQSLDRLAFGKSRADQLAGNLSGGWKQRLALAAAMLHEPKVLLLDEPTAGVDPQARREFWQEIHTLSAEGITTLVSTHYMDEAEQCHRLAYIAYGKMLAKGTVQEIIKDANLIAWQVTGDDLNKLAEALNKRDGVEQASIFGRTMHVLGKDEAALEKDIEQYRSQYTWQRIDASLEDIFIHLVASAEDNFA